MIVNFEISDRIVNHARRLGSRKVLGGALLTALVAPVVLYADVVNTFQDGDVIYADDINDNFADLDGRVGSLEVGIAVDGSGNLGLGTDAPEARLHMSYSGDAADPQRFIFIENATLQTSGQEQTLFEFNEVNANGFKIWRPEWSGATRGAVVMGHGTAPTPYVQLAFDANNGNVGIGTTHPNHLLDLGPSLGRKLSLYDNAEGTDFYGMGVSGGYLELFVSADADEEPAMVFNSAGSVGIGTRSPASRLHVAGTITEDSDARLKADIQPIEGALQGILNIDGVTFRWLDASRGEGLQMGVIAQDVEAEFPELVRTASTGFKSVNYSGLVAPLIQATHAQQATLDAQAAEIGALKAENAALNQRLMALETGLKALSSR